MKKFLLVAVLIFSISAISFSYDYWYLDVELTDNFTDRKTGSIQRAYFFKDLATLESATGFPGNWNGKWNWEMLSFSPYSHSAKIYSVMLRDSFRAAFILHKSGISNPGNPYFLYTVYYISNGKLYLDLITFYDKPVIMN